jgi:crossover junction endodeoxyribonuclease RusA
MTFSLPFPPSVNHYWMRGGRFTYLSAEGKRYRRDVVSILGAARLGEPLRCRLAVEVVLHAPDNRRRDLDNFGGKALLDALQHGGLYADDSQIDRLVVERGEVRKGGEAVVTVRPIAPQPVE